MSSSFSAGPPTQVHADLKGGDLGFTERRSQLVVLSGPESGRVVDIQKTPFIVGKGDECDLVLTEPTVSRTHFRIDSEQGAFVIRDLASTNGTWIDQFRIKEAWLRPGTVLRAGSAQLRFEPVFRPIDAARPLRSGLFPSPLCAIQRQRLGHRPRRRHRSQAPVHADEEARARVEGRPSTWPRRGVSRS